MSKSGISTTAEFLAALKSMPSIANHPLALRDLPDEEDSLLPYGLWKALLRAAQEAIDGEKWTEMRKLLTIYDSVMLAGKRSEMFESSYVAFLEDIRLPKGREQLREFWRHAPKIFAKEIKHDRRLR